jgi:hypothetical protein
MVRMNLNDHSNPVDGIDTNIINRLSLGQNYPNPFSNETLIDITLPFSGKARIVVKDLTGRTILIKECGILNAGDHQIRISGTDLEAGNYFYTLQTDNTSQTKKMTVVR